jgi:hypothetical protein
MNKIRQSKKRVQCLSVLHEGLVLLKDLPKPSMPNRTYMSENHFERGFNAFSGLHKGLVLLKDLSKPLMPNRTYMSENHFERGFNAFSGLHKGLVLLKDLSKPLMPNRTYMSRNHLKIRWWLCGSNASWIYMGFSAIERLT